VSEETVPYEVNQAEATRVKYAGFWMRFWAYLVDVIIVSSISGLLMSFINMFTESGTIHIGFWTLTGILSALTFYLYFLLMTKYFNQTLGKMIFGLKVIRGDGENLTWGDLLFREVVGRFIHRVLGILIFLYIVVAFSPKKQGIHDMIADTRVVFTKR